LLSKDVVKKYRADNPDHPEIFGRSHSANAEPAIPAWVLPVADLFPEKA
jgi:hypothetical protein